MENRGWSMEAMQMRDVWWRQKKQIRRRAVVQQWQKVAARRKERKVAKAVAEPAEAAVEAAATEEAVHVVDAAVGAGETTADAVAAAEADGATVDWSYFLAAAKEAEEEWW